MPWCTSVHITYIFSPFFPRYTRHSRADPWKSDHWNSIFLLKSFHSQNEQSLTTSRGYKLMHINTTTPSSECKAYKIMGRARASETATLNVGPTYQSIDSICLSDVKLLRPLAIHSHPSAGSWREVKAKSLNPWNSKWQIQRTDLATLSWEDVYFWHWTRFVLDHCWESSLVSSPCWRL